MLRLRLQAELRSHLTYGGSSCRCSTRSDFQRTRQQCSRRSRDIAQQPYRWLATPHTSSEIVEIEIPCPQSSGSRPTACHRWRIHLSSGLSEICWIRPVVRLQEDVSLSGDIVYPNYDVATDGCLCRISGRRYNLGAEVLESRRRQVFSIVCSSRGVMLPVTLIPPVPPTSAADTIARRVITRRPVRIAESCFYDVHFNAPLDFPLDQRICLHERIQESTHIHEIMKMLVRKGRKIFVRDSV